MAALACAGAAPADAKTVWLCRPGLKSNPCTSDLTATVFGPKGKLRTERAKPAKRPPVDCFYIYPTVSSQQTPNANLEIGPEERGVAVLQAARFSQVCRVFAPMYRQITRAGIAQGVTATAAVTAYSGVSSAFTDYLAHYNKGRGIVFIGHSQGASMLIALLKQRVDDDGSLRGRTVSALLLGGNVRVPIKGRHGGDFQNIPPCRALGQTLCVVGYSSFEGTPPPTALFGRVTGGLNPFVGTSPIPERILCVNPGAPGGGTAKLMTYLPSTGKTPWIAYPGEYTGRCRAADGATWLQIDRPGGSSDERPAVRELNGPNWGLHSYDVNLALGNLVAMVRAQSATYTAR
jgi:hypothetical protein